MRSLNQPLKPRKPYTKPVVRSVESATSSAVLLRCTGSIDCFPGTDVVCCVAEPDACDFC